MSEAPATTEPVEPDSFDDQPSAGQKARFGCAITLLLLLWLTVALYLVDVSAPHDHDLRPRWSDVSEDENPLARFVEAYRAAKVRRPAPYLTERSHLGSAAAKAAATYNLAANEHALAAFDNLITTSPTTWRWRGIGPDVGSNYLDDKTHPLSPAQHEMITMAEIVQMRGLHLAASGEPEKAMMQFLDLLLLFQSLEAAEGQLPQQMTVMRLRRRALLQLETIVRNPAIPPSPETFDVLINRLQTLEPSRSGLQFMLRAEYELWSHRMGQWIQDPKFPGSVVDRPRALFPGAQFKPNLTLVAYGWRIRPLIQALDDGWPAVHRRMLLEPPLTEKTGVTTALPRLGINTTGAQILHLVETGSEVLVEDLVEQVSTMRLMTLQLALRKFELQHQRLPNELAALTPSIVPSLPIDPGTGEPIQWDPTSRQFLARDMKGAFTSHPYWWSPAAK